MSLIKAHVLDPLISYLRKLNRWSDKVLIGEPSEFEKAVIASRGEPFVFDDGSMRSLHFSDLAMQSAMWIDQPVALVFGYTHCMMSFLSVKPQPRNILIIGLGGGSLAKFCHFYIPQSNITVLESDSRVIALRDQFDIPKDNEQFRILHVDGADFVNSTQGEFDVILLDTFDELGPIHKLTTEQFYNACLGILSSTGILVGNHWGTAADLSINFSNLVGAFGEASVCWSGETSTQNYVCLAFKDGYHTFQRECLGSIKFLSDRYQLEVGDFLRSLTYFDLIGQTGDKNKTSTLAAQQIILNTTLIDEIQSLLTRESLLPQY